MALNSLSGRSFNEINQYYVFPWILNSYCEAEIDLSSKASYRELNKPIGI